MKKNIILFIILCLSFSVSSCTSNDSKAGDATKSAEGNGPAAKSSVEVMQTPDLTLFELKGNVKSVKDEYENTYNFTKEGKLDLPESQIKRDNEGRIISYTINEVTTEVQWNKDGNVEGAKGVDHTTTYTYDDRGLLLTSYTEVDTWELSIYKYLKFDEQGNWVERERSWLGYSAGVEEGEDPIYRNKEVEKRTISYY